MEERDVVSVGEDVVLVSKELRGWRLPGKEIIE